MVKCPACGKVISLLTIFNMPKKRIYLTCNHCKEIACWETKRLTVLTSIMIMIFLSTLFILIQYKLATFVVLVICIIFPSTYILFWLFGKLERRKM